MSAEPEFVLPSPEEGRLAVADGTRLVYSLYRAEAPRAGVIITHGYAEHRGRYRYLLEALVSKGVSVLTWDCRGHGESGGVRGTVGRFDTYLDDFAVILRFAQDALPRPLFAFGHSMGGLIMTRFFQQRSPAVAGLIVSNPSLGLRMRVPAWKLSLAKLLSRLVPGFNLPSDIPPELISRDPAEVQRYKADPLVFGLATARWAVEFMAAQDATLSRPADLAALPVLVLLGGGDGIADAATSRDFYGRCTAASCDIRMYDGFYHELINEGPAHREQVFNDLLAWLDQRVVDVTSD